MRAIISPVGAWNGGRFCGAEVAAAAGFGPCDGRGSDPMGFAFATLPHKKLNYLMFSVIIPGCAKLAGLSNAVWGVPSVKEHCTCWLNVAHSFN